MSYNEMTAKQKRTIERDVEALFSVKAFIKAPDPEELKELFLHRPRLNIKGNTIFLSARGVAALDRLTDMLVDQKDLALISRGEVFNKIHNTYNSFLERELQPTGQEFSEEVIASIAAIVKDYEFLVLIDGIDIGDQDVLELGSSRILRSDLQMLRNIKSQIGLNAESIYAPYKESLWLIGGSKGSEVVAHEKFLHGTTLTVGILAICGALLYKGAIWRSGIRVHVSSLEERKAGSSFRWEVGGANPSVTVSWGAEEDLPLDSDSMHYLSDEYFLKQLSGIPDRENPSELEEAITRSIFWFAEAYRDRNPTMQFVKLWSCIECFFSVDKEDITEFNARGLSSILAFAGYSVISPQEYPSFKRRVKALYDLRSKAIHRGEYRHIEKEDLEDLSLWVALLIVSMVSLVEKGYTTLNQIKAEAARLDSLTAIPAG